MLALRFWHGFELRFVLISSHSEVLPRGYPRQVALKVGQVKPGQEFLPGKHGEGAKQGP